MQTDPGISVFQITRMTAVEAFEDGVLVLQPGSREVLEFNHSGRDVFELTDGDRTLDQVAQALAALYGIPHGTALADVTDFYGELSRLKLVQQRTKPNEKEGDRMTQTRFVHNPDVILREEDEEGGLLFNPDTNEVKVLNLTALFIWKHFAEPQEAASVVGELVREFEDAPQAEVAADVQEFLEDMVTAGFIGTVEA